MEKEKEKLSLREIIIAGIKKFLVGIIAAMLTSCVLWSFPEFRNWLNDNNINGIIKPKPSAMSDEDFIKLCMSDNARSVEEAIMNGANVNAKADGGSTALTWAAFNGHTDIVKILIKHGADVNAKNNYGDTALMDAAVTANTETAELLLKHGADVNAKTNYGYTALMRAVLSRHTETVELLLKHGADVNAKTNDGNTALMLATKEGYTETANLLRRYGAKE